MKIIIMLKETGEGNDVIECDPSEFQTAQQLFMILCARPNVEDCKVLVTTSTGKLVEIGNKEDIKKFQRMQQFNTAPNPQRIQFP